MKKKISKISTFLVSEYFCQSVCVCVYFPCLCTLLTFFSYLKWPHTCIDFDLVELASCHELVTFFSSQQDAVEENELRKKQEQAMREKLLAQEAKQHDPKVQSQCMQLS